MSIKPSILALSSTRVASGTISRTIHSATAYPLPGSLPFSTLLASAPDQCLTLPSSLTSLPRPRLPLPSGFSPTMPPSEAVEYPYHLGWRDVIGPLSSPSVSSASDVSGPNTSTSAGTNLPPSSPFSSNSNVSPSLTFPSTTALTMMSSISAISSPLSLSLSANSSSMSEFPSTSTLTTIPPLSTTPTAHTFSSPEPVSSDSASHSASSPSPTPASTAFTLSSTPVMTGDPSAIPGATTVVISTTLVTSVGLPSASPLNSPSTSTFTITSVLLAQGGTATDFVTTNVALSTEPPGKAGVRTVHLSPGTIAAVVLGIVGAVAFAALWLFCARRRHRKLVREAALLPPENPASGPLDDEVLGVDELGYGAGIAEGAGNSSSRARSVMEERYAGILAALHLVDRFGRGNEGASTGGIYGSHRDSATDMHEDGDGNEDGTRVSSPTLPFHTIPPDDPPYLMPLSPPPPVSPPSCHQTTQPVPPPSAYYMASRRKSSPGPDAIAGPGGSSVAPSYHSHNTRSQTLGSGSRSGSGDALNVTRTGSEEPLLGIGKLAPEVYAGLSTPGGVSPTLITDLGSNKIGLGSAFGSPAGSMYCPSGVYSTVQHDATGSYGARTVSGSGSYGYARSGTPSSFDVLRSVSSQGALSSAYSHGHGQGFRFGFGRPGSSSSAGTDKKAMSSFSVPPTSFKARKDRGSAGSDKEKQGSVREKDKRRMSSASTSTSMSADEKQGRASPAVGVRAFLGRLRRGGRTPSPHSSNGDLPSPSKALVNVDPEKAAVDRAMPPPIQIQSATPRRRRFSFILWNPDPQSSSPYSGAGLEAPADVSPHREPHAVQQGVPASDVRDKPVPFPAGGHQPATPFQAGYVLTSAPSPVPTEESRFAEGLLHPRLQTQGTSEASLRDFEDYSRPIGGVVKNRLYSTTTFGTQDDAETKSRRWEDLGPGDEHDNENESVDVFGTPVTPVLRGPPRDSWFGDGHSLATARHSPLAKGGASSW